MQFFISLIMYNNVQFLFHAFTFPALFRIDQFVYAGVLEPGIVCFYFTDGIWSCLVLAADFYFAYAVSLLVYFLKFWQVAY